LNSAQDAWNWIRAKAMELRVRVWGAILNLGD
jgi:hypothetical protein